jgi:hypothetical protein
VRNRRDPTRSLACLPAIVTHLEKYLPDQPTGSSRAIAEVLPGAALLMNPQDESEIRAIIALHREIAEKKKEVSKRLGVIRGRERASGNKDALMFVVDGEIWQMKRWAELEEMVTPLSFDAWCLEYKGKAL